MDYTGSQYEGDIKMERLEGKGKYTLANGTIYEGQFLDGEFHGEGILYFPNLGKFTATWQRGRAINGRYTFRDGLEYDQHDWEYCIDDDRRFYTEINNGLRPAGESQGSNTHPPPEIRLGWYDCNDGMYNPEDGNIYSYGGKLLRKAKQEEAQWIVANCRVGQ